MNTSVEEIKQRLDIVDAIQGYVRLTQAGSNWKGKCPFHNEKTPSFMVSRDKQIWHCFGCGKGGDIFTFIQEVEGMEFAEALKFLAERAGVELQHADPKAQSRKQRLYEVNAFAANVFHTILLRHEKASAARDYLQKRGIKPETIEQFQIGYAPESWEGVSQFLRKHNFTGEEIFQAGLTIKRDKASGHYDRFRNRIMFPISDQLGRVIGFGARALLADQQPKYVNTPQSDVYNKSAVLFGLHLAKSSVKSEQLAVLVEGYMDAIASHQANVKNVVAVSGTALTREQLRIIKRYTPNVALAFDTDIAGQAASMRGIKMAWEEGMNIKVVVVPEGKDPDELIRHNAGAWKSAVNGAKPFMEYAFWRAEQSLDLTNVEDKKKAAKQLLALIAKILDPVEQTHYLQLLASRIRVPEQALRSALSRITSPRASALQGASKAEHPAPHKNRPERIAERILALACKKPELWEMLVSRLEPAWLAETPFAALYKSMLALYTANHVLDLQRLQKDFEAGDGGLAKQANVIFLLSTSDLLPDDTTSQRREITEGLAVLKRLYLQTQLKRLEAQVASAEQEGRTEDVHSLLMQVNDIAKELAVIE